MKKNILVFSSFLLALLLAFPASWDRRYIDELGYTRILLIDKAKDDPKKIIVYSLRPYVDKNKSKFSGTLNGEGGTLIDALAKIQAQETVHIVMGSVSVVLISKDLAEDCIINIMSQLDHLTEFESQSRVVILSSEPSIIKDFEPPQQKRSDMLITDTLKEAEDDLYIPNSRFFNVMSTLKNKYTNLVLPIASIKVKSNNEQALEIDGLAVFDKVRMIDKIAPQEVIPYMLLKKEASRILIDVPKDYLSPNGVSVLSIGITKNKTKVSSKINDDHLKIKIDMNLTADIIDFATDEKSNINPLLSKEKTLKDLEVATSKYITKISNNIIYKMQHETHTDIFGIGKEVKNQNYDFVNKNPWNENFSNSSIEVKVNLKLREIGENK